MSYYRKHEFVSRLPLLDSARLRPPPASLEPCGEASDLAIEPITCSIGSLELVRRLTLEAVSSPLTREAYGRALGEFSEWREIRPSSLHPRRGARLARGARGERLRSGHHQSETGRGPQTREGAAKNGLLDAETAAQIELVSGAKQSGQRSGDWLTRRQAQALLDAPAADTLKGKRDRAALALLVDCGLRRSEAAGLTFDDIQQRDGRWAIVDLRGKHGRIRTVPVPAWVKAAVDLWREAARLSGGRILRAMNRHGQIIGDCISGQAILDLAAGYGLALEVKLRPHDLRRSCAKLCRAAGGELEQIQLLLGHASIQTT